ncbi:hypothetical protein Tco_1150181 [Tanacetum coccineum]
MPLGSCTLISSKDSHRWSYILEDKDVKGEGLSYARKAGGVAADASGNPLDFSKGRYLDLDTGIIVTNQKLMPSLLKAVQDSLKEQALPSL